MIAVIDYGVGNLLSVLKALRYLGAEAELVDSPEAVRAAPALVLPGVGNFGDGMEHLNSRGLTPEIKSAVEAGKPFLGICLGMQLLFDDSEEAPGVRGLGVFKGSVVRFPETGLKIPHIGWNSITVKNSSMCLRNVADGSYFYFVHSYYPSPADPAVTAAVCSYGVEFTAAVGSGNVFATQFHPEKSQGKGLEILRSFIAISHHVRG